MHYIKFKDKTNYEMGLTIARLDLAKSPEEKVMRYDLPLRDGEYIHHTGVYKPYQREVIMTANPVCGKKPSRREIHAWLSGTGTLQTTKDPGVFFRASVISGIEFEQIVDGVESLRVVFEVQPQGFAIEEPLEMELMEDYEGFTVGYLDIHNDTNYNMFFDIEVTLEESEDNDDDGFELLMDNYYGGVTKKITKENVEGFRGGYFSTFVFKHRYPVAEYLIDAFTTNDPPLSNEPEFENIPTRCGDPHTYEHRYNSSKHVTTDDGDLVMKLPPGDFCAITFKTKSKYVKHVKVYRNARII